MIDDLNDARSILNLLKMNKRCAHKAENADNGNESQHNNITTTQRQHGVMQQFHNNSNVSSSERSAIFRIIFSVV